MPIYEYTCRDCGNDFEWLTSGQEQPTCPNCGRMKLTRKFSVPAAHSARAAAPACPAQETCGMPNCCGMRCHPGQ